MIVRRQRVAAVVRVHEDVGARLQFRVDATVALELPCAGARAGDRRARDACSQQEVARVAREAPRRQRWPRGARQVCADAARRRGRRAGRESAARARPERLAPARRRATRHDAAAMSADVDLDQHVDRRARLRRRCRNGPQQFRSSASTPIVAVRASPARRASFVAADDFVGDEHVANACLDKCRRLITFWQQMPTAPRRYLPLRDFRTLVRLGVRPQRHAGTAHRVGHEFQVALERIEVDDQRRCFDGATESPGRAGMRCIRRASIDQRFTWREVHRRCAPESAGSATGPKDRNRSREVFRDHRRDSRDVAHRPKVAGAPGRMEDGRDAELRRSCSQGAQRGSTLRSRT